jgi:hypothetical protein
MAFSISRDQTILWDQIRYQGDPAEFVWVLPVKAGARVELARDEWIGALDALSAPVIRGPAQFGGGGGSGCGCSADSLSSSGARADNPVQVVNQSVVGPYETVTLRSSNPNALEQWLADNQYSVPDTIKPTIRAYVREGFDFLAMKLRPGQGVRAMRPVRVVSPGADVSMPLRMVAAGVGANVGLTLFVVAEGRYHPQNFPDATLDFSKLVWDYSQNRSNYQPLAIDAMAQNQGRAWLTEYARNVSLVASGGFGTSLALSDLYYRTCFGELPTGTGSARDAGRSGDDGGRDAGPSRDDAGEPFDGGPDDEADAGASEPPNSDPVDDKQCRNFDDYVMATAGMNRNALWVTRLRSNLPLLALDQDLRLEATVKQVEFSNVHNARDPNGPSQASVAPFTSERLGSWAVGVGTVLFLANRLRRRRQA